MKEIVNRLHESRQVEIAKEILESAGYKVTKNKKLKESASNEDLHQALMTNGIRWKVADVLDDGTAYVVTQSDIIDGEELERILKPAGFTKGFTILRDYSGYDPKQDIKGYVTGRKMNYFGRPNPNMYGHAFGIEKEEALYDIYLYGDDEDAPPVKEDMTLDDLVDFMHQSDIHPGDYAIVSQEDGQEYSLEDIMRFNNMR